MWVLAVILIASVALPTYIVQELFAAMLLFSVLFVAAALLLSGAFAAWHVGARLMAGGRVRTFTSAARRFTAAMLFKTRAT
jgi:hypothetical protein